jgi:hypothetical protein
MNIFSLPLPATNGVGGATAAASSGSEDPPHATTKPAAIKILKYLPELKFLRVRLIKRMG